MKQYRPLPKSVSDLLQELHAPPRLVAHLTLVHDVSITLTRAVKKAFPTLEFDEVSVQLGAAVHDIGKAKCPEELTGRGNEHEVVGQELLKEAGFPEHIARFAFTHGGPKREPNPTMEDLLVQQADAIWKGARHHKSEMVLIKAICAATGEPEWQVYSLLDDILTDIAGDADSRLGYQSSHPV